jgi:hypothetical protein
VKIVGIERGMEAFYATRPWAEVGFVRVSWGVFAGGGMQAVGQTGSATAQSGDLHVAADGGVAGVREGGD